MNIVIVGGTSQVATELAVRFREADHNVYPTVRSQVGASFYAYHDFPCRIVDMTDAEEASAAVGDADVVVIAAFARQYAKGFKPKRARNINKQLVKKTALHAPRDATLIYFSTIAIYGDDIGLSNWDSYAKGKRAAEKAFLEACDESGANGYVLRMGPVYGVNQDKARSLRNRIKGHRTRNGEVHVACNPDRPSNILHTVTLANAIKHCHREKHSEDIYTLVNEPPWYWREVIEYYAPPDTTVHFHGTPNDSSLGRKIVGYAKHFIESRERTFRSFMPYLPSRVNQRIFNEYVKRRVANDVAGLDAPDPIHDSQFDQRPAPGPYLDGLDGTRMLLDQQDSVSESFQES